MAGKLSIKPLGRFSELAESKGFAGLFVPNETEQLGRGNVGKEGGWKSGIREGQDGDENYTKVRTQKKGLKGKSVLRTDPRAPRFAY